MIGLDGEESWSVIAPGARYDEFGMPSSAKPWAPTAAVYLLLREIDPSRAELPIRLAPAGAPAPPPGAFVVDMRRLLDARPK